MAVQSSPTVRSESLKIKFLEEEMSRASLQAVFSIWTLIEIIAKTYVFLGRLLFEDLV